MNGKGWLILLVILMLIPASRDLILAVAVPALFLLLGGGLALAGLTGGTRRR